MEESIALRLCANGQGPRTFDSLAACRRYRHGGLCMTSSERAVVSLKVAKTACNQAAMPRNKIKTTIFRDYCWKASVSAPYARLKYVRCYRSRLETKA